MDTSYLSQQVNTIINQLHGLFDEIGVSDHDRENREADVSLPPPPTAHRTRVAWPLLTQRCLALRRPVGHA